MISRSRRRSSLGEEEDDDVFAKRADSHSISSSSSSSSQDSDNEASHENVVPPQISTAEHSVMKEVSETSPREDSLQKEECLRTSYLYSEVAANPAVPYESQCLNERASKESTPSIVREIAHSSDPLEVTGPKATMSPAEVLQVSGKPESRRLYFYHDERGTSEAENEQEPRKTTPGLYSTWDDDVNEDSRSETLGGVELIDGKLEVSAGGKRRYLYDPDQLGEDTQWRHDKFDTQHVDGDVSSPSSRSRGDTRGTRRARSRGRWRGHNSRRGGSSFFPRGGGRHRGGEGRGANVVA